MCKFPPWMALIWGPYTRVRYLMTKRPVDLTSDTPTRGAGGCATAGRGFPGPGSARSQQQLAALPGARNCSAARTTSRRRPPHAEPPEPCRAAVTAVFLTSVSPPPPIPPHAADIARSRSSRPIHVLVPFRRCTATDAFPLRGLASSSSRLLCRTDRDSSPHHDWPIAAPGVSSHWLRGRQLLVAATPPPPPRVCAGRGRRQAAERRRRTARGRRRRSHAPARPRSLRSGGGRRRPSR